MLRHKQISANLGALFHQYFVIINKMPALSENLLLAVEELVHIYKDQL
jgi:hypothetical protein